MYALVSFHRADNTLCFHAVFCVFYWGRAQAVVLVRSGLERLFLVPVVLTCVPLIWFRVSSGASLLFVSPCCPLLVSCIPWSPLTPDPLAWKNASSPNALYVVCSDANALRSPVTGAVGGVRLLQALGTPDLRPFQQPQELARARQLLLPSLRPQQPTTVSACVRTR